MTSEKRGTVLFLPLSKGNLLEMLPIAEALHNSPDLKPIFCLDKKVATHLSLLQDIPAIRTNGQPICKTSTSTSNEIVDQKRTLKQKIFSLLPPFFRAFLLMRAECRRAKQLLDQQNNVCLIVTSGDRNIGIETAVIAEANKRKIPSLIVPFAMSFPEASAEPRLRSGPSGGQYNVQTLLRRALKRMFPSWVLTYKDTPLFFHPPYTALAAYTLGIMPKHPWMIGGGAAKKMAVESDALRKQLLEQGMPAEKMTVTGKPSLDDIAQLLASISPEQKCEQLGIKPHEKVILCSVPNFAEHDLLPWDKHKEEMLFLFKTMKGAGAHVLLSLHPRSEKSQYQPLADETGATFVDERIYTVLPAADILISSYSSTIAQAVALQKPSIVIDFIGLDYPVYDTAPGSFVLKDKKELPLLLKKLLDDDAYYNSCVATQRERGKDWALLDGKNTERVLVLIKEVTAH